MMRRYQTPRWRPLHVLDSRRNIALGKAFSILCVSSSTLHNNIHSADREWMPTITLGILTLVELPSSHLFSPTYSDRLGVSWSIAQQNVTFSCLCCIISQCSNTRCAKSCRRSDRQKLFFLSVSRVPLDFGPLPKTTQTRAAPHLTNLTKPRTEILLQSPACDAPSRNHHHTNCSISGPRILSLAKFQLSQPITRPEDV